MGARKAKPPSLTRLEGEVMNAIWSFGDKPVCVRDVLERMNSGRDRQLAYNTVQTVFTLLRNKEAIQQVETQGRAHYFVPSFTRDQATSHSLADLAQRMFGGKIKPILHRMIDEAEMTTEDLQELRDWVDARLKNGDSPKTRRGKS